MSAARTKKSFLKESEMGWSTAPAQTNSQRVYRQLKHDIVTCSLLPGKALSEQGLCRRYHISRTPVREACQHLEKDGLVVIVPFRGYFVAPLTMAEFHSLNELQLILEPAAAAMAAQRITPPQTKLLQDLAEYVYRVGDQQSYYTFLQRNFRFHVSIADAAANRPLYKTISEIHTQLMRFFFLVISFDAYGRELVAEHREIARAIARHDSEQARHHAAEHIIRTMQRTANLLLSSTRSSLGLLQSPGRQQGVRGRPLCDREQSAREVFDKEPLLPRLLRDNRKSRDDR